MTKAAITSWFSFLGTDAASYIHRPDPRRAMVRPAILRDQCVPSSSISRAWRAASSLACTGGVVSSRYSSTAGGERCVSFLWLFMKASSRSSGKAVCFSLQLIRMRSAKMSALRAWVLQRKALSSSMERKVSSSSGSLPKRSSSSMASSWRAVASGAAESRLYQRSRS